MEHCLIACTALYLPPPNSITTALQKAGHKAAMVDVKQSTYELAVGPNGNRMFIDFSADLSFDKYIGSGDQETLDDLFSEAERRSVRRLVSIRHWPHTETEIVTALIDYICTVASGRQLHDWLDHIGKNVPEMTECNAED